MNIINDLHGRNLAKSLEHTDESSRRPPSGHLSEDEVKQAVARHLESQGWNVEVAWGRQPGIEIEARRGTERLVIEAKGEVERQAQQHNYFVNALGELVQRFDDPDARYGLALPNHRQYRGLVDRLPDTARAALNLVGSGWRADRTGRG